MIARLRAFASDIALIPEMWRHLVFATRKDIAVAERVFTHKLTGKPPASPYFTPDYDAWDRVHRKGWDLRWDKIMRRRLGLS